MENNNNQSFWQFSDQIRLQNASLADLSLNDSIWSVNSFGSSKRPEDRRNFDIRVGGGDFLNNSNRPATPTTPSPTTHNHNNYYSNNTNTNTNTANISPYDYKQKATTESNDFNNGWKLGPGFGLPTTPPSNPHNSFINGGFNKGIYSKPYSNHNQLYNSNFNLGVKGYNSKFDQIKNSNGKGEDDLHYARYQQQQQQPPHYHHHQQHFHAAKGGKKNKEGKKDSAISNNKDDSKNSADKRFKTLPPSEALPRNEKIGGYIFVCNNDTMEENLKRQLFGLPPRYRDSVRAITPGLPLFLYNYSTHQLHGIYEAASFGGTNIDASAWEDKKNLGESRFPAQVRVQTRKICEPLDEDAFRPILHHYDGPKFRLELSIPEAISLLDIFEQNSS